MLRLDLASPRAKPRVLTRLERKGHVMRCDACDGLSAYAWCDVDESLGAGFWDRGNDPVFDRLTKACRPYGSCDAYVGDDGLIYLA